MGAGNQAGERVLLEQTVTDPFPTFLCSSLFWLAIDEEQVTPKLRGFKQQPWCFPTIFEGQDFGKARLGGSGLVM